MLDYHDFLQANSPQLFGIKTIILTIFMVGILGNAHKWGRRRGSQNDAS